MADPAYLVMYLIVVSVGIAMGWWLRDVKAKDDEDRRSEIARYFEGVERAKLRHPAYKENQWREWRR